MTSPDRKPPYPSKLLVTLAVCQGSQTPVEAYVGIKEAYLGSFG
jgi:hypothetical protein